MLVHGAAGGVGTAALQVAKGLGARTIAVVSSEAKEQVALEAGADHVVRSDGAVEGRGEGALGRRRGGRVRPGRRDRFHRQPALAARGRPSVVVGFAGGSIPEVKVNRLLLGNTEIDRRRLGRLRDGPPARSTWRSAPRSTRLIEQGFVRPIVGERFPAGARRGRAARDRRAPRDRQDRPRRAD